MLSHEISSSIFPKNQEKRNKSSHEMSSLSQVCLILSSKYMMCVLGAILMISHIMPLCIEETILPRVDPLVL